MISYRQEFSQTWDLYCKLLSSNVFHFGSLFAKNDDISFWKNIRKALAKFFKVLSKYVARNHCFWYGCLGAWGNQLFYQIYYTLAGIKRLSFTWSARKKQHMWFFRATPPWVFFTFSKLYHSYNLENVKNTHGGVSLLVKSNTPPWVFFTIFKLYEWYQIAQSTTYTLILYRLKDPFKLLL